MMDINPDFKYDIFNKDQKDISPDSLSNEMNHLLHESENIESNNLFTVKSANQWIQESKDKPIPKMLFDRFWYEGELCFLFADTNLGKSILAVQIGDSISNGISIPGFLFEAVAQKVLYFDFELSAKQFEGRYSKEYSNHYVWHENFKRSELNPDNFEEDNLDFDTYLIQELEKILAETGIKVLIIDNITYLKNETEKAKNALPLMKQLKMLKSKYNLSILALAHTPKRDLSKPISRNDLQGSKMLINFCDSAFAIGESFQDTTVRYIKQIKARNTEIIYDTNNVCLCQIDKPWNFLLFEFYSFGTEREHLKILSDEAKSEMENKIIELYESKFGSNRQIANHLGTNHNKVGRVIKRHLKEKQETGTNGTPGTQVPVVPTVPVNPETDTLPF
jgi:RecA-family ATPase